ncbi:NAD(P)/FAD-dependent oxidoreductase [Occultella kanbiaonis]|uniref:NAD(P)/FAD-dependent oxidoreductase n=1 Tax=Occultella kanbiaonis TaxID=2675754 RepID=UPI002E282C5E|nr:NAD(P)/FAD-dependent oxidoreductase [Occultella kanbiaonis]
MQTNPNPMPGPNPDEPGLRGGYDVVVIGGAAAGLSAALTLSRARRSVLVVDAGQPRNTPADGVHNYLGREGTPPGDLLAIGRAEVRGYGGEITAGVVTAVGRAETDGFEITLADGRSTGARHVLLASGARDELPDVPGLAERFGRDVLHCPYCHGWEVRDLPIGVLASSPMAMHQVLLLRQWSADVTLFLNDVLEPSETEWEQLTARGIAVVDGAVAAVESADDRLTGVRLASGAFVPRSALAVQTRVFAPVGPLEGLGLQAEEFRMGETLFGTYLPTDGKGETSVPGIWAAGNVADVSTQVITAAAAGMRAGAQINAALVAQDTAAAVEAARAGRTAPVPVP